MHLRDVADLDNLRLAVRFVRQDKEDEEIRDPLRDLAFLHDLDERLKDLSVRILTGTYDPRQAVIVEAGKSNFTTRPTSHIAFEDWIVAQAILNVTAETIDAAIPDVSYAMRLNPRRLEKGQRFFRRWYREWPNYRNKIRRSITHRLPCVLITDISGYYEHIDLGLLNDMLLEGGLPRDITNLVFSQLERWTWQPRYARNRARGLLQGNDVASMYANFYLHEVDEHFVRQGIRFFRYMDDMSFHVADRDEAKRVIADLTQFLRQLGLSLNSGKTKILQGREVEQYFSFSLGDRIEKHIKTLATSGESAARSRQRARLHSAVDALDVPNAQLTKRLLTAYSRARDRSLQPGTLRLLSSAPDWTDNLCRYFRAIETDGLALKIAAFLENPAKNIYPAQEHRLLRALLHMSIRAPRTRRILTQLGWHVLRGAARHPYSRALGALLIERYGEIRDLRQIVSRYTRGWERHPLVKKHLALAAARLPDRGSFVRVGDALKQETDPDLTELGLWMEKIRLGGRPQIGSLLKQTRFSDDPHDNPKKSRVRRISRSDFAILGVAAHCDDARTRTQVRSRIRYFQSGNSCPASLRLLQEIEDRL